MMKLLVFILACFAATAAQAQDLVLRGGTVVNPDGSAPIANAVVVVRGGRIVQVGRAGRVRIPEGVQVIDSTGKWIVPGYIDSHVHFFQSGGLYTRPDGIDLRRAVPYESEIAAIRGRLDETFARYLASGVTAVADVGGPMENFEVRARSAANPRAPRVGVAGPLISTWRPPVLADVADPPIIAATTPEEARALVRTQVARRPDFIKLWYVVRPGETAQQFLPVVRAAIEEAHSAGIRVAVHATELETARAAVEAGADLLVHGVEDRPVDAAFIALLRRRGTIYTTTLDVYGGYLRTFTQQPGFIEREYALADPDVMGSLMDLRHLPDDVVPAPIRQLAGRPAPAEPFATLLANLRTVRDAGIPIAMGTDAGNIGTLPGPSIYREFAQMARAGLTPREVLASATITGARFLGRADDLGLVAPGRLADMVVLDADPLADVANLSRIAMVVKDGRAWRQSELVPATPEEIVQRQLNAYNARDLEAFIATYHPDVQIYDFPDAPTMQGHAAMRRQYGAMFERAPALHAYVPRRIAVGNYVIDEEIVSGLPEGRRIRGAAIYEVRDGLITRVWFTPADDSPAG
ncbi:amidohydrolase family protein [Sphingosinicella sp. YJ22]|uniref:amidohydrolase family protein n=1 Tax=Sphingosinicella sp. YJ22 TaxID=1104780 RepID=UPI00140C98BC|nr:amidohydrolase family protein [Sphingosinicella sp. YJ22]